MFGELLLDKLINSKVIIYGIGYNGLYTFRYLKSYNIDVIGFADIKAGDGVDEFQGKPCKLIEDYENKELETVIITPYNDNIQLSTNISDMGYKECITWHEMECLFRLCPMKVWDGDYMKELQKNALFFNAYSGKRCFIVGTGPSIKKQDLSVLKNEYVFTVNTGYKSEQYDALNSSFHVFVDSMYFSKSIDEEEKIAFIEAIKEKLNKTVCFFPYTKANAFIEENGLNSILNINYLEEDLQEYWTSENIDFTQVTPLTGTVVLTAVLLAIYMGFKEIYLLGCDCTDIYTSIGSKTQNANLVSYAWNNDKRQQKRLENTLGTRSFESIYHIQYLKFKTFRQVNSICKEKGIALYDCTLNGLLDCIEKKDFLSLTF